MSRSFGKYQLLKRLSEGGMGEVFLARQQGIEGFEKLLVLKTLLPHLARDTEFINMFLDEARIAARLAHPNLITIFDLGQQDGAYYLAMDYVHGEDFGAVLHRRHEQGGRVPPALACRVIAEAAAGLGYAHRLAAPDGQPLGLVHRDISPQNILVSFDGEVKLIDFGIAKARGRMTRTDTGVLKGKWAYMAPEQAGGKELDARSDLFSLGVVLWEALTNRRLFRGESEPATIAAVMACKVTPPSELGLEVPQGLDAIVLRALQREPNDRYPDVDEFRLALERWLADTGALASTAHLGQFMREAFKERLEREEREGPLLGEELDPEATRAERAPKAPAVAPPAESPTLPTARSRRRVVGWSLVAAAVLVFGFGGLFAWFDANSEPPAGPASVAQPIAPPAGFAVLKILSSPSEALVTLDGVRRGSTPLLDVRVEAGRPLSLLLEKEGYLPKTQPLVPTAGPHEVMTALEPAPAAPPVAPAGPAVVPTLPPCPPSTNCFSTLERPSHGGRIVAVRFPRTAAEAIDACIKVANTRAHVTVGDRTATTLNLEFSLPTLRVTTHSNLTFDETSHLIQARSLHSIGNAPAEAHLKSIKSFLNDVAKELGSPGQ